MLSPPKQIDQTTTTNIKHSYSKNQLPSFPVFSFPFLFHRSCYQYIENYTTLKKWKSFTARRVVLSLKVFAVSRAYTNSPMLLHLVDTIQTIVSIQDHKITHCFHKNNLEWIKPLTGPPFLLPETSRRPKETNLGNTYQNVAQDFLYSIAVIFHS